MKLMRTIIMLLTPFCLSACFIPAAIEESEGTARELYHAGEIVSRHIIDSDFSLHYVSGGNLDKPAVVFIHGTPGNWKAFGAQLGDQQLRQNAHLISIDRPGWGDSAIHSSHAETSLMKQAALIAPLLVELKQQNKPVILVGHSLGATLVARITMAFPKLVDATVIIAGDLTEDLLARKWYNEMASWPFVHALLPRALCYANDEVLALPANLLDLNDGWQNIDSPIWVIQGGEDSLVDPKNAEYARNLKTGSDVHVHYFEKAGHLVHLTHADAVNRILLDVVAQAEKKAR